MDEKQKKRLLWQVPFLALLIVGTVLIIRQQQSMPYQHDEGFVFGTVYSITYQSSDNLKADIEAELQKVDDEFSMFNERSTVARINRGETVQKSDIRHHRCAACQRLGLRLQARVDAYPPAGRLLAEGT